MAPSYELNFKDYLRILQKRYWILVVSIIAITAALLIKNAMQVKLYQAEVTVRAEAQKSLLGSILGQPLYYGSTSNYLASEILVITSRPVAEEATRRVGLISDDMSDELKESWITKVQSSVRAEIVEDTDLIKIIAVSRGPKYAASIANAVAESYRDENLRQKNKEASKSREFIENQLIKVETQLKVSEDSLKSFKEKESASGVGVILIQQLAELQARHSQLLSRATEKHPDILQIKEQITSIESQLKDLPQGELEFARLTRDLEVNDRLYRTLRDKVEEARIAEAEKVSDVTIINPAGEYGYPVGAGKSKNLVIGISSGFLIGLVLMFVTEGLDTSIATIEDVENFIKLPVLGIIPSLKRPGQNKPKDEDRKGDIIFTVCESPTSAFAESFRILRTNLKIEKGKKHTFLVTSTAAREGKSSVLIGLGLVFAQAGLKTLIVDTDLRRPTIARVFGVKREPGFNELVTAGSAVKDYDRIIKNFTDFLMGDLGFDNVTRLAGLESLCVLTSGSLTSSSSEILSSPAIEVVVKELRERFDVVIFDSPPALTVTDAAIISKQVDSVILVYEMGRTSREALQRTKVQLESAGAARIKGIVLNHTSSHTEFQTDYYPYQSYKYKYQYTKEPKKEEKKS